MPKLEEPIMICPKCNLLAETHLSRTRIFGLLHITKCCSAVAQEFDWGLFKEPRDA